MGSARDKGDVAQLLTAHHTAQPRGRGPQAQQQPMTQALRLLPWE